MANTEFEFWSNRDRVEALRELLRMLLGRGKAFSPERVVQALERDFGVSKEELPGSRALRNFLAGQVHRLSDDRHLTHLLRWGVGVVSRLNLEDVAHSAAHARALNALEELDRGAGQGRRALGAPVLQTPASGESGTRSLAGAMQFVATMAMLTPGDFDRFSQALFGPRVPGAQERELRYTCYRYHSRSGFIVRSLLKLMEVRNGDFLLLRYIHDLPDAEGSVRTSSGVVMPMRAASYLIGAVDGAGLEVMSFANLEAKKANYPGLALSLDEEIGTIAGRCVLVPSSRDAPDSHAAIVSERDMGPETRRLRHQLRNRINFTLDEDILFDGLPISQDAMVSKVEDLLRNPESGTSRFTYVSGAEFNPAARRHYTYNAALHPWWVAEGG